MRKPYEVYKKYKELQKSHFNRERAEACERCPTNCRYNRKIHLSDRNIDLQLCSLGQGVNSGELDPSLLLVCSAKRQALECNAYSPKHQTPEDIVALIQLKAQDPQTRRESYPELVLLEWVMNNQLHELQQQEKKGIIHRVIFWAITKLESIAVRVSPNTNDTVGENK